MYLFTFTFICYPTRALSSSIHKGLPLTFLCHRGWSTGGPQDPEDTQERNWSDERKDRTQRYGHLDFLQEYCRIMTSMLVCVCFVCTAPLKKKKKIIMQKCINFHNPIKNVKRLDNK